VYRGVKGTLYEMGALFNAGTAPVSRRGRGRGVVVVVGVGVNEHYLRYAKCGLNGGVSAGRAEGHERGVDEVRAWVK
jgi:hypothetical protein